MKITHKKPSVAVALKSKPSFTIKVDNKQQATTPNADVIPAIVDLITSYKIGKL